jgi:hypothetical protein
VRVKGWEMELTPWAEYRKAVIAEVRLKEYQRTAFKNATSNCVIRTPRTYSALNLDWFVLYQLAGMSSVAILKRYSRTESDGDESTVLKGVKAAAKLLGWGSLRGPASTRSRKTQ